MRDEDHGHVRSENNRRRSEDVGFGWVGRRRPGFVNASVRTVTKQVGCRENAQARIDMLVLMQTTQERKWNRQEHGCIRSPKQWKRS